MVPPILCMDRKQENSLVLLRRWKIVVLGDPDDTLFDNGFGEDGLSSGHQDIKEIR